MALEQKQPLEHQPKRRFARCILFALFVCLFAVAAIAAYFSVREWRYANLALDAASDLTDGGYIEQAAVVLSGYDEMRRRSLPLEVVWSRATDSRARDIRLRLESKFSQAQPSRPRRPTFTPNPISPQWSQREKLNDKDVDLAAWLRAIEYYPAVTRPLAHEFAVSWATHYRAWQDIHLAGLEDKRLGHVLLSDSDLTDIQETPHTLGKLVRATALDFVAAGSPAACADPSRRVTLVCVNQSRCPCTVMVDGVGPEANGNWWFSLEDGSVRPRFITPDSFHLKAVVIERGGRRERREVNVNLLPGTTHEIRIGTDDAVDVVAIPSE